MPTVGQDLIRLNIDIATDLYDELEASARERGISVPELLRRAIALDRYIWEHRDEGDDYIEAAAQLTASSLSSGPAVP